MVALSFFFNDTATTEIYTLSLHDALPILPVHDAVPPIVGASATAVAVTLSSAVALVSAEHTAELTSHSNAVFPPPPSEATTDSLPPCTPATATVAPSLIDTPLS